MRTENTKAESKPEMKTKRLGNSDLSITPVGFGAWAIGGSGWEFGWGEQDDKASIANTSATRSEWPDRPPHR